MDELEKRFNIAKGTTKPTNCIGTLLYLCGKKEEDSYFEPINFYDYFTQLIKIENPIRGSIVLWEQVIPKEDLNMGCNYRIICGENRCLNHGAVISKSNPIIIYDRFGAYDKNANLEEKRLQEVEDKIENFNWSSFGRVLMNFYKWKD